MKIMFHVFQTHTSFRGEGLGVFPSPGAYIEGESSEFFQVPGSLCREKAIYDSHLASLFQVSEPI